jgi:hypothetical protein
MALCRYFTLPQLNAWLRAIQALTSFPLNAFSKMDGINVRRGQAQLLSGRAAIAALKRAGQ